MGQTVILEKVGFRYIQLKPKLSPYSIRLYDILSKTISTTTIFLKGQFRRMTISSERQLISKFLQVRHFAKKNLSQVQQSV